MHAGASHRFDADGLIGPGAVVLVFSARWCRPCQVMAAALQEIGDGMPDRLRVTVVDVEASPALPARLGVRGLPTTMIFMDGMLASTRVGELPKDALEDWIDAVLQPTPAPPIARPRPVSHDISRRSG